MYLFFDTETTGLPRNYQAPLDDFSNWPRLVQLAWSVYDFKGNHWESFEYIIKPDGFVIPKEASDIHRVTQERAMEEGEPIVKVLKHFVSEIEKVTYLVAHNIDFDEKIIGSELLRNKMSNSLAATNRICTMKRSSDICRIPSGRGTYKWPNLSELHTFLFQTGFSDAHDAMVDVKACADCFFELKRRKLI